jgi:hypothetical protein
MTYLGLPHVVQHSFDHGEENPPVVRNKVKIRECRHIEKSAGKGVAKIGETG